MADTTTGDDDLGDCATPPRNVVPVQSTRASRVVAAPPAAVYAALLDPAAVAAWRVPDGMSSVVHVFEPREGGRFQVSLTYDAAGGPGKSQDRTDTYAGRFVRLVPGELVVEELAFESPDPALRTPMRMTTTLAATDGGTLVTVVHEGLPDSVPAADNELGTRTALDNLARLVAARAPDGVSRPPVIAAWHQVVEARDRDLLRSLVADDCVFRSPAVHAPQEGKRLTLAYLSAALVVLGPTLTYHRELFGADSAVLEFTATLDGLDVHGVDLVRWDDTGKIVEFAVMVRPLRGLEKLIELMRAELENAAHGGARPT